jgi:hypothetical protein
MDGSWHSFGSFHGTIAAAVGSHDPSSHDPSECFTIT